MPMSFRQLEIFERVATTGSVTKASAALRLTQSAVSMALAQLEGLSNTPLFERSGRRLLLNDNGRRLLPIAREILLSVRHAEEMLQEVDGEIAGELRIGGSTTIGNYLLPQLLGTFMARHPACKTVLRVGNTQQISDWLEAGELDIAFVEGPSHHTELVTIPWREDELVVITGPEHAWTKKKRIASSMLATAPWIMRETNSGTREIFEHAMEHAGIHFSISMEFGHTEAIKNGVAAGLGVSCLSRIAVEKELEHGLLAEVDTPLMLKRSLNLLKRRQSSCTHILRAFLRVAGGRWEDA